MVGAPCGQPAQAEQPARIGQGRDTRSSQPSVNRPTLSRTHTEYVAASLGANGVYAGQTYDWKGRPRLTTNTDGRACQTDSPCHTGSPYYSGIPYLSSTLSRVSTLVVGVGWGG